MRLTSITDEILAEAVAAQAAGTEFDTHDVARWVMQNWPRQYVMDLALALNDKTEPFMNVNGRIDQRLAQLPDLVKRPGKRRNSWNVRGEKSPAEVWMR